MPDDPKTPINKLRLCINAIRRSSKLLNELQELCNITGEKYHEPANDCPTRWSSTHTMISTAVNQKKAMTMLMATSDTNYVRNSLDAKDWAAIEDSIPTLAVFSMATEVFSLQNYANMYTVSEIYSGIIKFLDREPTDASKIMAAKLREYSNKLPEERWLAEILDPNHKLDRDDPKRLEKFALLKKHAEAYADTNSPVTDVQLAPTTPGRRKKTPIEKFRELIQEPQQEQVTVGVDLMLEIDRYIAGQKAGGRVDPCSWWKANEGEYPTLAIIARDWLAVPASSVPCEQLFSQAGNTITKNRNRLSPETAQILLCLKSWWTYSGTV